MMRSPHTIDPCVTHPLYSLAQPLMLEAMAPILPESDTKLDPSRILETPSGDLLVALDLPLS
jgi:hypothetical protein